jgi:hypothetical protein
MSNSSKNNVGKSEELYDLRKTWWKKFEDLYIIYCAKLLKPQWENRRKLSA